MPIPNDADSFLHNPLAWVENIPSPIDLREFQKELNKAGGVQLNGTPNYRIVWGQDFQNARIWNRYKNEWNPMFWHTTLIEQEIKESPVVAGLAIAQFKRKLIMTPRFFILKNIPPDVAYATGTESGVDSDKETFSAAHIASEGEWIPYRVICDHDEQRQCCARSDALSSNCWGWFRLPGQVDLAAVRLQRIADENTPHFDPRYPTTAAYRQAAHLFQLEKEQKRRDAMLEELDYSAKNFLQTHKHRLSDDPSVVQHGKYHFL